MGMRNHVAFRINQEIPSVKLIVFVTSTTGRAEKKELKVGIKEFNKHRRDIKRYKEI
jgi:hypothetical protein